MTTQTLTLPVSLDRRSHRALSPELAGTWTTSASAPLSCMNAKKLLSRSQPPSSIEFAEDRRKALQVDTFEPLSIPPEVPFRCRRTSEHSSSFSTSFLDDESKTDASSRGETATAMVISHYRPQAINVTPRTSMVKTTIDKTHQQRLSSPIVVSELNATNLLRYSDQTLQQRLDANASWESQSTISDSGSFLAIESTTSASTTSSTHAVVKGFTPGGPPSMYRSQSNLSQLSRHITSSRSNTPPVHAPERENNVTMFDEDAQNEHCIDEDYEDMDSCSDFDDRSNYSGLAMLFASNRTIKPSGVLQRPPALSPRKTRNQMLAAELTKPIQESLLQDRQHKRQVNLGFIRRSHSEILYSDRYFNAGIFQYW